MTAFTKAVYMCTVWVLTVRNPDPGSVLLVRTLIENLRVNRETEYIHIDLITIITMYIFSLYTLEHLHQTPNFSVVMLHISRSEVLSDLLYRHVDSARLCARLSFFPARVLDYQPFKLTKRRPLHRTAILLTNHKPANDPIVACTDWQDSIFQIILLLCFLLGNK